MSGAWQMQGGKETRTIAIKVIYKSYIYYMLAAVLRLFFLIMGNFLTFGIVSHNFFSLMGNNRRWGRKYCTSLTSNQPCAT